MTKRSAAIGDSGITSTLGAERYRPYPAYKDSGVEWLGEIPAHWVELPLKRIARIDNSGSYGEEPESSDCVLAVVTTAQIDTEGHFAADDMPLRGFSHKDADRFRCRPGDILVVKSSGSISNVISGKTGIVDGNTPEFVFSNFLLRVIAHVQVANPRYLFLLLSSDLTRERVKRMVAGSTYPNLRVDEYTSALLPIPSLPEQRAIAAFLDRETSRIDALVAKKERLIELLEEKRTALINQAVTKGFDSDVPMKNSGVEWLGEIPAHWEVKRWRNCCKIAEGLVDPTTIPYCERTLIAPNHIQSDTGMILLRETAEHQGAISGKYHVDIGQIVYSKIRPELNKVCIAEGAWLCSADMYPITVTDAQISTKFLQYFMLSEAFVKLMVDESLRSAIPKVNSDTLSTSPLLAPPPTEQQAIVSYLDRETAKIDSLVAKVREAIDRLKELRTALISTAVTGKIDVRQAAA